MEPRLGIDKDLCQRRIGMNHALLLDNLADEPNKDKGSDLQLIGYCAENTDFLDPFPDQLPQTSLEHKSNPCNKVITPSFIDMTA